VLDDELAFAPALDLAARVRAKEISPGELVELYRARIDRLDPQLNAFVTLAEDPRPSGDGPFYGVPLPIKDLTDTAGLRTTYSCKAFAQNVPAADAAVVRRIRAAGFTIIGKTNTPEFGTIAMTESELNGDCRNPWDTTRTPGGSSGGAAAAVSAGLAPAAHGSDGGGSIRIPSSCCGLFGIKPTRGRVSPAPHVSGSLGLSTSGPITRTVRDAAALLDVMSGNEPGDMYVAPAPERPFLAEADETPGRLRIAVTTEPPAAVPVDPECAAAARAAGELLAELGHDVEERSPPWQSDELMAIQQQMRRLLPFWNDVDVVVTPTLALKPVPIGWTWADADGDPSRAFARQVLFTPFTAVVNATGQPAISVPLAWSADGLPIGVQVIGRHFAEATLIRLAAQLEEARPWARRRPPAS
jgi:amidase